MSLREYQKKAIDLARESFKKGNKNIALVLATGAGKSIIAKEIIKSFREKNKNGKVAYFTFRTVLIDQMKETLKGLDVEIDTLQAKGKNQTDYYDLVLIDEVHYAKDSKLQNNIKAKFKIGLTATPITPDGYALNFDDIIDVVQLADLIELGFASPVKVLATSKVDTSLLKTQNGDFNQKQSYELMSKSEIIKDIANVYLKYADGLKTIVYAVNIKHCEELLGEFLSLGIKADSIHSKKNDTKIALDKFAKNEIQVLINVDVLTTGFDAPDIYCLILASPTKSLIKATQIYGRATRLNPKDPNKTALIIDCCEVVKNTQHPLQKFDFSKKKSDKGVVKCECGLAMKLVDRKTKVVDKYEYVVFSHYKCECEKTKIIENIKLVNIDICENCNKKFEKMEGLHIDKNDKSINFNLMCKCGHFKPFREIIFTQNELKEIRLQDAQKAENWDDVAVILRAECKKAGYHHRWSNRCIEVMQNKNKTPKEVIGLLKKIKSTGKKLGSLMYV